MSKEKSSDHEYGTIEYFRLRTFELEADRNTYRSQSEYYQTELAKAHEILGRVLHQTSERWDSVNLTKFYPTDNLQKNRSAMNPTGKRKNHE